MMGVMKGDRPVITSAIISAESVWLRRLSAALVREGGGDDDAIQETWLTGLAHPPEAPGPLGGWLRVVLRNIVRKRSRGESRRRTREREAAGILADTPGPEELAVRLEAQRLVADLVLALDEPYRSTVMLCYYEGLAPIEVARRLDVPAPTVRWRLSRALAILRAELDRRYQAGPRPWRALLVALGPQGDAGRLGGLGKVIIAMKGTTKLAVLTGGSALFLVAGGLSLRHAGDPASPAPATAGAGAGRATQRAVREPPTPGARPGGSPPRARVLLPRFTPPPRPESSPPPDAAAPRSGAQRPGTPAFDKAAMLLVLKERMREAGEQVKACLKRWVTPDPALASGVQLWITVDEMGLQDVWLEGRSDVPSGSLGCLSEAVYRTDWSGVTTVPVKTSFKVRFERTDGGAPP
jgi:RNA polymerase sigma factor (sigma-70 family)